MKIERELLRGAGPIAVLNLLKAGEKYGYELVDALSRHSEGLLDIGQSTLYPMLYNLEAKGLITSRIDESGSRPRKYLSSHPKRRAATRRGSPALEHPGQGHASH